MWASPDMWSMIESRTPLLHSDESLILIVTCSAFFLHVGVVLFVIPFYPSRFCFRVCMCNQAGSWLCRDGFGHQRNTWAECQLITLNQAHLSLDLFKSSLVLSGWLVLRSLCDGETKPRLVVELFSRLSSVPSLGSPCQPSHLSSFWLPSLEKAKTFLFQSSFYPWSLFEETGGLFSRSFLKLLSLASTIAVCEIHQLFSVKVSSCTGTWAPCLRPPRYAQTHVSWEILWEQELCLLWPVI